MSDEKPVVLISDMLFLLVYVSWISYIQQEFTSHSLHNVFVALIYRISIRWTVLPSFLRPGVTSTLRPTDSPCSSRSRLFSHLFGANSEPSRFVIFLTLAVILLLGYIFFMSDSVWYHSKTKRFTSQDFYQHGVNSHYHYGIVVDCGSSGSRVFIYYWPPHNGKPDELLKIKQMKDSRGNPVRMKIKPGVSLFFNHSFDDLVIKLGLQVYTVTYM